MTSPKGAVSVMLAFVVFTLMCAWFSTMLGNEFNTSEIVPDDSYTKAYFTAADKLGLFWDSSFRYNVIFKVISACFFSECEGLGVMMIVVLCF